MPVQPTQAQLAELGAIAGTGADGPVIMLNLNRYRERAAYDADPPGGEDPEVSGREAYARYGAVASGVLERVGGAILWHAQAPGLVIGDEANRCDEVLAVRYPSVTAFLELALDPQIMVALAHRTAGLERATIIRCEPGLGE